MKKRADSKVGLYKEKGGRMMICHPFLVKMTRHTPPLQEKAHYALSDKQDPLSCLNEAG
ncbi:hypothetical protein [Exiguobacterium acetylicum]|uniref:hypothetical protein n=1 Tax=Exiguobacterium acetylicum TaxID=41170 RepID=UPI00136237B2|nr:hypothetical protein [Exiguobacterium acetylicum]